MLDGKILQQKNKKIEKASPKGLYPNVKMLLLMNMEGEKVKHLVKPDVKQDTVEEVNRYASVLDGSDCRKEINRHDIEEHPSGKGQGDGKDDRLRFEKL